MSKQSYSTAKSIHVQNGIKAGLTKKQANTSWTQGGGKAEWERKYGSRSIVDERDFVPDSDEWDDFAHTSDDL